MDQDGTIVVSPRFIWADDFWRGLGTVYACGRYVSIDASGNLLPLRIAIEGELVPHNKDEKFGFVDNAGDFKIAPTFDEVLPFSEGVAAVRQGKKWGFVDTSGRMVISPQFAAAYYFQEGIASAETDSGSVLIDRSGRTIAKGYRVFDLISEGRIPAKDGQNDGFLDLHGNRVVPSFTKVSVGSRTG